MAHSAFAVRRESCFLAFGVELMTELAVHSRADYLSDSALYSKMKLVREVEQDRTRLIVVWKTSKIG